MMRQTVAYFDRSPDSTLRNVTLLLLTAGIKLLLTAWTFGIQVPAGIFLPSIAIGATMGRAVGLIMSVNPTLFIDLLINTGWH